MAEHTPTPWGVANPGEEPLYIAAGAWPFGSNIARCEDVNQEANAAFIVKAVNNHDALVSHLRRLAIHGCDDEALALLETLSRWEERDD